MRTRKRFASFFFSKEGTMKNHMVRRRKKSRSKNSRRRASSLEFFSETSSPFATSPPVLDLP